MSSTHSWTLASAACRRSTWTGWERWKAVEGQEGLAVVADEEDGGEADGELEVVVGRMGAEEAVGEGVEVEA